MKVFSAIVALCLSALLFFQAHNMEGVSLMRMGYIAGAIILLTMTIFLFVPQNHGKDQ